MSRNQTIHLSDENLDVMLPSVPNTIYGYRGQEAVMKPIEELSDIDLKYIGDAWTQRLIFRAETKRKLKETT